MYKYHRELLPYIFDDYFQCVRKVLNHDTRQNYGLYASNMKTDLAGVRHVLGTEELLSGIKYLEYRLTRIPLRLNLKKH